MEGVVPDNYRAIDHLHNFYSECHTDSSLLTDSHLYQNICMCSFDNETFWILFVECILKSNWPTTHLWNVLFIFLWHRFLSTIFHFIVKYFTGKPPMYEMVKAQASVEALHQYSFTVCSSKPLATHEKMNICASQLQLHVKIWHITLLKFMRLLTKRSIFSTSS